MAQADREPRLIDIRSIRALPESTEAWQLGVRDTPHNCDPARLYRLLVLVSPGANVIRQMVPLSQQFGEEGEIVSALENGMLQPRGELVPARPPAIWVEDELVAERIALPMESCGVRVLVKPALPAVDPILDALAMRPNIFSDGPLFGTNVMERELAQAAAELARAEPWRYFSGELPLSIRSLNGSVADSIVVVLGQLREVEGLASYSDEQAYLLASCLPMDGGDVAGAVSSVIFDRASEVPREARLAFSRRQLATAHGLYPRILHFALGGRPATLADEEAAKRLLRDLRAVVQLMAQQRERIADGTFSGCTFQLEAVELAARELAARESAARESAPGELAADEPGAAEPQTAVVDGVQADDVIEVVSRPDLAASAAETQPQQSDLDGADIGEDRRLPELVQGEHALLVGDLPRDMLYERLPQQRVDGLLAGDAPGTVRALIVRAVKKVAARASEAMMAADEVGFGCYPNAEGREHEVVVGCAAGEPIFMLASVPASDDRPLLREMVSGQSGEAPVLVVFIGGGARRSLRRLRANAIVGVHVLSQRRLPVP